MSSPCATLCVTAAELTRQLPAATLPATMSDWSAFPDADPEDPGAADPEDLFEADVHPTPDDTRPGRLHATVSGLRSGLRAPTVPDPTADLAAAELAGLSIAGLTRRRIFVAVALLLMAWIVFTFVQQVGEAAAITTRADEMRAANAQLEIRVRAAQQELLLIQEAAYIEQQARAYRLGEDNEIPFALAADPPRLGADAPGSAANRVGADASTTTPLESWLSLLFGPLR